MGLLTEEPKALSTDIFNTEKTGTKLNQLDQLKKFTTAEGIRKFAADIAKLEKFIASKINS